MSAAPLDYDVLIIGGGMVGAALACALAPSRLSIGVIEAGTPVTPPKNEYDVRVSAVSAASCALFDAIGVWQGIKNHRVSAIEKMHVWHDGGSGSIHFDAADIGVSSLGYIIENNLMLSALQKRAQQHRNIDYHFATPLRQLKIGLDEVTALTDKGKSWRARVVVAADGAQSVVRKLLEIETRGHSFQQQAIVATVTTEKPHGSTAWQRFMTTGPLAFLPLKDPHQSSIVWSLDSLRAHELMQASDTSFIAELETAFEKTLGSIDAISQRMSFELSLSQVKHYVQPRVALVGDAAHRVHPLAGQGVNLGFADAAVLAQVMLDAQTANKEVSDYSVLRKYERWRKGDNSTMLAVTDGFKMLFGNNQPLLTILRNSGLDMADKVQPFKNKVMRLASGMESELPQFIKDVSYMP